MIVIVAMALTACGKNTPEPPDITPGPIESVTGAEGLGWTQRAADSAKLSSFRYAIYVDGVRSELTGVSCSPPSATSSDFACSAPLPAMSAGMHTLELASFIVDGDILESARSAALQVNKTGATTAAPPAAPGPSATWPSGMTISTTDGLRLRLDRVAQGLVDPADIAFMPDGRVFIAEERGDVRVVTAEGELLARPALSLRRDRSADVRLLSVAADSRGFIYAIYTARSRNGSSVFTVARFGEAANALFGEVVLLDNIPASEPRAAASLRVDADGKLFVAIDDGGDPRRAGDYASPNGKILRLNSDGTTPDDQAGFTPMYLAEFHSPRGFDFQPESGVLWIADRLSGSRASISAVGANATGTRKRGVRLASYALPRDTPPSSVAFYRGALIPAFRNNLLIASEEGRHLLRVKLDAATGIKLAGTEQLLQNTIGGIRVVSASPNGAIYLASTDTLATLTPSDR